MTGDQIDSWWTVATCVGTALGILFGVWIGASFNGNQPVRHCGGCDECDQLAFEPFTDAEVDRAFEALRYHLARRRGLHVYNQEEQS